MWSTVSSAGNTEIYNKKLQVRHVVAPSGTGASTNSNKGEKSAVRSPPQPDGSNLDKIRHEQMYAEITSLRRKYDELVSFSVNLMAEWDILNNTLEQTKRELNREMGARASLENCTGDTQEQKIFGFGTLYLPLHIFAKMWDKWNRLNHQRIQTGLWHCTFRPIGTSSR